jgi:hypothetical protein
MKPVIFLTLFVLISACTKQIQEQELSEGFIANQSKFELLSGLSCSLLKHDFKSMLYKVGDYNDREIKGQLDDPEKEYKFKWSELNKYGEQFKNNLDKIDGILVDLELDDILIRELSGECRLSINVWSIWMTGEGQQMTYLYNPMANYGYNPKIHTKSNRDLKTQIDFTMPLSSGWFVGYTNTP